MNNFDYHRPASLAEAARLAAQPGAMLLAGGTSVIDLAKCDVAKPAVLLDITRLPGLAALTMDATSLQIGALARMSQIAADPRVQRDFPAIAESLLLAASPQLRNRATIGGNLLQRTRCAYFRDPAAFPACNKRAPGSGCAAQNGVTRDHAVLGGSDACIAVYPGDLAVALTALDATVCTNQREIAIEDLFVEPGVHPERETVLQPGEVIVAIRVPASRLAARSTYLKVRDRQSYEFAAASAAVALDLDGDTIRDVWVALGGIATKPWRAKAVEDALRGKPLTEPTIRAASRAAVDGAVPRGANAYKIDLAPRVVARALLKVGGLA